MYKNNGMFIPSRGIDLSKVRGQTYDTTSSMSLTVNGVHGRNLQQGHLLAMQMPTF